MKSKREFVLASIAAGSSLAALAPRMSKARWLIAPLRTPPGPSAGYFPNVGVVTSAGDELLWYDDVIRGRRVMIHFFSFDFDRRHRVIDHLNDVYRLAGKQGSRRVTMISVAGDKAEPAALAELKASKGIGHDWLFLSGAPESIDLIRSFLYIRRHDPCRVIPPAHGSGHDHSMAVARYGNEALERWASFPVRSSPQSIVRRFDWI